MAKSIDEILCENMYKFVKEHFYEITTPIKELGFSSRKDLLTQIKNNPRDAAWALVELCTWGMKQDYAEKFFLEDTFERDGYIIEVFKLKNKNAFCYCTVEWSSDNKYKVTKVKKKPIKIMAWQECE